MKQPILNGILESDLDLNGFGFVNVGGLLGTFQAHSAVLDTLAATSPSSAGLQLLQFAAPGVDSLIGMHSNGVPYYTAGSALGDVTSTESVSVDGQIALFNGTSGKQIRKATATGIAKLAGGVLGTVAAPTGNLVGHDDTQTLYNKTLVFTSVADVGLNFVRPAGAGTIQFLAQEGASNLAVYLPAVSGTLITGTEAAAAYVPASRTVNGHALSSNVTVTPTDLGLVIGTNVQAYDADLTTWAGLTPSANAQSLVTAADYAAMKTLLGLVIGTNVQAYNANLTTWASLPPSTIGSALVQISSPGGTGFIKIFDDIAQFRTAAQFTSDLSLTVGTNVQAWNTNLDTWAAITPGTGVATALAVNVGSAGAFVTFNGALGTPSSGTLTNCTFPTLNQNTTGSAAKWTTARNLAGNSVDGSANVAFANKFIVQGTVDAGLSAAQFLGALGTGIVKNTTTTGVLSIAVAGDFPTLNQNTSGSAATLATGRTLAITGDLTWTSPSFDGSGNVTAVGTLATVASAGTTGSSTAIPVITINAKGLTTGITTAAVVAPAGTLTGTTLASGVTASSLTSFGNSPTFVTPALGTPASGTVTNLTGTASININGTVGATTPAAGTFTTLVAGSATSLLLGTAGTSVGSVGFRNATSGTVTLAPPTGALGTYQITLPNAASTLPIFGQQITFAGPTAARTVTLPDAAFSVGYLGIPQNSNSAAYTTVLADSGKHIFHPSADTTARTFTIDSNANVAYPIGTAITFVNQHSGGVVTIAITSDTMRLAGTGTTGSRTLAADGVATAIKVTSTEWIISGTGLT